MAGLPLSQAIGEYLAWLELDRHASTGTVEGYRGDLRGSVISPAATPASRTSPNWTATSCAVISATSRGCAPARKAPGGRWPSPPDHAASSRWAASCASPPARSGYPGTS
ncbi:MAG: hypothetical protein QOG18_2529, partial [Microbacteriaceae bacterium]|nr:hypothetical protein [Microbacteriaceae bacterium]